MCDEVFGERVFGEKVFGEKVSGGEMSEKQVSDKKLSEKKRIIGRKSASPLEWDREKERESWRALLLTFLMPGVVVTAFLFLLISWRGGIESAVANFTQLLPVGFAFAAGMVASVNPCGVLLLPSYIFYQLRPEAGHPSALQRALRGLLVAAVVTASFVLVFALVGGVIAAGGQWLVRAFPYIGLLLGVAMVALGAWILAADTTLSILVTSRIAVDRQRTLGNAFVFGLAYAVGSLSCTLPIFLAVVGTSLAGAGLLASLGQFFGYALGMGIIIFAVTLGAALFRRALGRWLRLVTPYVHYVSAMFAIGAGAYLVYYWIFLGGLI
jgi:cytochrome c biogenesis protein CcdA